MKSDKEKLAITRMYPGGATKTTWESPTQKNFDKAIKFAVGSNKATAHRKQGK